MLNVILNIAVTQSVCGGVCVCESKVMMNLSEKKKHVTSLTVILISEVTLPISLELEMITS